MASLESECKHEKLLEDSNYIWCAKCGRTKTKFGLGNGVSYDD